MENNLVGAKSRVCARYVATLFPISTYSHFLQGAVDTFLPQPSPPPLLKLLKVIIPDFP